MGEIQVWQGCVCLWPQGTGGPCLLQPPRHHGPAASASVLKASSHHPPKGLDTAWPPCHGTPLPTEQTWWKQYGGSAEPAGIQQPHRGHISEHRKQGLRDTWPPLTMALVTVAQGSDKSNVPAQLNGEAWWEVAQPAGGRF